MFISPRLPARTLLYGIAAAVLVSETALADPLEALPYAISGGSPNVDVRLRYESVDQDLPSSIRHRGEAATLRTRLGYTTGRWSGMDAQLEFEHLGTLGLSDFNSTENLGKRDVASYPVIADPEGAELNQAWLRYTGPAKTSVKLGRQRIVLDNARFIGNVGWRQREQTYDAALLSTAVVPKTVLQYAYLDEVHAFRAFNYGTAAAPRTRMQRPIEAHLLHAAAAFTPVFNLSAYGYWLDFGSETLRTAPAPAAPLDSKTFGLRGSGALPAGGLRLSYAVEYARQDAHGDASRVVDADYGLAELSAALGAVQLKLGYEVLGSNNGRYAFQTPLATSHAFQGWADLFLTTPPNGVEEAYASLSASVAKLALLARYSHFSAAEGAGDYGDEIDLQVARNLSEQWGLGLKYAAYNGRANAPVPASAAFSPLRGDVEKAWAWIEYKF